jgi:hypothetical protein
MNRIVGLLKYYDIGLPANKPEVLKQIEELKKVREAELERIKKENGTNANANVNGITIKIGDEPPRTLSIKEIVQLLQEQHTHIIQLTELLKGKDMEIDILLSSNQVGKV